jgi:hypothetical protein
MTALTHLDLWIRHHPEIVSAAGVQGALCALPCLVHLNINARDTGDWSVITGCLTRLRHLEMHYASDDTLQALRALASLTSIRFVNGQFKGAGLEALRSMPDLSSVTMQHCYSMTTAGLMHFCGVSSLELESCFALRDGGMTGLADLTRLTSLHLHNCSQLACCTASNIKHLVNLTQLDLTNCKVQYRGVNALRNLPSLARLNLDGCVRVFDCCLVPLRSVSSLTSVSLVGCSVTQAGVAALRGALDGLLHVVT